ncbi:DUF6998 domain-containing protein [Fibrobacter sp.]|uniref:DUF6998 domain-containing protein n=1 Tax=Fibrobacter sp. TaxID=35828 RepID=UPI0038646721
MNHVINLEKKCQDVLKKYYEALSELEQLEIIRSKNITGDIGEFLALQFYPGLKLVERQNNPDFDAVDADGTKYQIKYSDSSKTENIDIGNPLKYDKLIVILGPNSKHKQDDSNLFSAYVFSKTDLEKNLSKTKQGQYTLTKGKLYKLLLALQ